MSEFWRKQISKLAVDPPTLYSLCLLTVKMEANEPRLCFSNPSPGVSQSIGLYISKFGKGSSKAGSVIRSDRTGDALSGRKRVNVDQKLA